jgi:hypothetical protein
MQRSGRGWAAASLRCTILRLLKKDLDPNAEDYIVTSIKELRSSVELLSQAIHLVDDRRQHAIEVRIHAAQG